MAAGLRVLVAGAGLGGLTAALALRRVGFAVEIFEQASTLGDVGAGIQIAPNAVKVLRALGLEEPLTDVAVRPLALEGRDWASGAVLQSFALDEAYVARYGAPYFHVHRADLHQVLLDGVRQIGDIPIHLDAKVEAMAEDGDKVTILTSDGHEAAGDVLVGADGIHSSVRAHLFGPDNPHFTGTVAFRTTIPIERLPADFVPPKGYNWMGPRHHFVHYYLRRGELMNCVGVCEMPDWRVESWVEPGDIAEFRAEFDGWHETIQTMIDAAERCWKWALYDRDPLERWSVGRITLLGDAAHPMLPFLAQGACMGMEDGYVLARCLQESDDAVAALAAYEAIRRPRASDVQLGARAKSLHLADKAAVEERNAAVRADPDRFAKSFDWLYEYDVVAEHGPLTSP